MLYQLSYARTGENRSFPAGDVKDLPRMDRAGV